MSNLSIVIKPEKKNNQRTKMNENAKIEKMMDGKGKEQIGKVNVEKDAEKVKLSNAPRTRRLNAMLAASKLSEAGDANQGENVTSQLI